jgi:uncharacterized repeat protein (TIGR03803 family)
VEHHETRFRIVDDFDSGWHLSAVEPSTPAISQVFVFFCNPGFTSCPNGFDPILTPIQLSDGNLYAVTFWGGQGNANAGGTVARTSISGQGFAIHTFQPVAGMFLGGENPAISFLEGPDGNLYGVTESGGTHNFGVMYKLQRNGTFQVLYNFCSLPGCPDNAVPLLLANDGNFYGVGFHSFFRITPQGTWTQISTLTQAGAGPGPLIQANDGNFYGPGFRVTPSGQFTVLHQFHYPATPTTPVIQASDGNLYGATGGSGSGTGIYRMSLSGDFAFIHQMTDSEGYSPVQLLQASDGNLWGISDFRNGSFFSITLSGGSILSASFNCAATGCAPLGMFESRDGNFYGVAGAGGNLPGRNPLGTIFKIAAGLGR